MLLIGSQAVKHYYPDARAPMDTDVFCTEEELDSFFQTNKTNIRSFLMKSAHKFMCKMNDGSQVELEVLCGKSSSLFVEANKLFATSLCVDKFLGTYDIADPYVLFFIKKSHIAFNVHWDKNIKDYHFLKSKLDFILTPQQEGLLTRAYQARLAETTERHSKHEGIKPGVDNDAFFNKYKVSRVVPHDSIHQGMAYFDSPLFLKLKRDINSAEVCEDLFNSLSYDDRVKCIQEEAFVLALERIIIPKRNSDLTPWKFNLAFEYALRRLSTDLKDNPSFIKEFSLENYPDIVNYSIDNATSKAQLLLNSIDFPHLSP